MCLLRAPPSIWFFRHDYLHFKIDQPIVNGCCVKEGNVQLDLKFIIFCCSRKMDFKCLWLHLIFFFRVYWMSDTFMFVDKYFIAFSHFFHTCRLPCFTLNFIYTREVKVEKKWQKLELFSWFSIRWQLMQNWKRLVGKLSRKKDTCALFQFLIKCECFISMVYNHVNLISFYRVP